MFEVIFFVVVAGMAYFGGVTHTAYKCAVDNKFKAPLNECINYDCKTKIKKFDCWENETDEKGE